MKKKILNIFKIIFLIFVLTFLLYKWVYHENNLYNFIGNKFFYSEDRGKVSYEILEKNITDSLIIYKIRFDSRPFLENSIKIYGLLFITQKKKNPPGIIYLPGGGGTKEGFSSTASKIAELGYAVFVIDQRGVGETGGVYLNFEQDYQVFLQKKEPMHHLAVYDILRSYDVLREIKEINNNNIAIIGESMGARYGIIAASMEKRLRGIIAISTSGFHFSLNPLNPSNDYLVSIDPDYYISEISPNYVFMLHGTKDNVIPLNDAKITFDNAKEPKFFFIAEDCSHGYCEKMDKEIEKDLKIMFNSSRF